MSQFGDRFDRALMAYLEAQPQHRGDVVLGEVVELPYQVACEFLLWCILHRRRDKFHVEQCLFGYQERRRKEEAKEAKEWGAEEEEEDNGVDQ
jgi:hypothetical protein